MEQTKFKIGDIVRLKSGGPDMTVKGIGDSIPVQVQCQWFAGKKLEAGWFPPSSLLPVTEEKADAEK